MKSARPTRTFFMVIENLEDVRYTRVNVRGIAPYSIDRIDGADGARWCHRRGCHVSVMRRAYAVRCINGDSRLFRTLAEAKAWVRSRPSFTVPYGKDG